MKKLLGICAAAAMLAGFSTANAAYVSTSWEDYVPLNTDLEDGAFELFDNLSWTHNFNDNGYTPLIDQLTGGWVRVTLANFSGTDSASVQFSLTGLTGIGGGGNFSTSVGNFNLTSAGLGILWTTGTITGNLEPIAGSFRVVGSLAHLDGLTWVGGDYGDYHASVPEPGPLALFAIGLLGMGAALRRRSRG